MKQLLLIGTLMMSTVLMVSIASADYVEGRISSGDDPLPVPVVQPVSRVNYDSLINFDEADQPCGFMDTVPLSFEYLEQNVVFSGPEPGSGGAVLNECGNFGISGHSAPNFLAFNCDVQYGGGGYASAPERLDFMIPVTAVSALVGASSYAGFSLEMKAYDSDDVLLVSTSIILASNLQEISVESADISYVVFGQEEVCVWVLDDLGFDLGSVAEDETTWDGIKSMYR